MVSSLIILFLDCYGLYEKYLRFFFEKKGERYCGIKIYYYLCFVQAREQRSERFSERFLKNEFEYVEINSLFYEINVTSGGRDVLLLKRYDLFNLVFD